jgi:zinc protease
MPSPKITVAAAPSTRIQRVISPKGIEAWLVEDYTIPIIALDFAFIGGGALDAADKSGLTYLMAGLMDEGAGSLDATAFQEKLEDSAIELNFNAGRDRVEGSLRAMQSTRDQAFRMLALAINEPRFDEDALERGKAQMTARLKRGETDPDHLTWKALHARAYAGHAYGRPEKGAFATIPNLTRADCLAAHRARLSRGRLKIAAVGAISAAELGKGIDRVFASLADTPIDTSIPETTVQGLGETLVTPLDVPQSTLALVRPGLARKDPDFMAAFVVNHILGGGSFTSRLWTEVREKRGLAYSVWSQMSTARHSAAFFAGTSTSNERIAESLKIIEAECLKMAEKGPTRGELTKALKYLIGSYALRFDTSRKIAGHLVELQIEDMGIDYIARRNEIVAGVTLADTRRAAERLIGDGKMLVSVCGKPKGIIAS